MIGALISKLRQILNLSFCYIDDALSSNNQSFGDFIDRIYHKELKTKDTIDILKWASYRGKHSKIDGKRNLLAKLYDKRDEFSIGTDNFLSSVATSLQHLRMGYSKHNSYVMPEIAVTMQIFVTR